jgi:hypothetical protein
MNVSTSIYSGYSVWLINRNNLYVQKILYSILYKLEAVTIVQ